MGVLHNPSSRPGPPTAPQAILALCPQDPYPHGLSRFLDEAWSWEARDTPGILGLHVGPHGHVWTPSCSLQLLGLGSPQGSRWDGPPKGRVVALQALRLCWELWGLTLKHGLEGGVYVSGLVPRPLRLLPTPHVTPSSRSKMRRNWYSSPYNT